MAAAGKLVDIPHWTQCYAFDVIGAITVGYRIDRAINLLTGKGGPSLRFS